MSELVFSFLGPVRLSHPQLGEITIPKRKAPALLIYLVIEVDRPHARESLLGLLWPEQSTAAAQNNLRVTWSQLQKCLEKAQEDSQPYLLSSRLDLQFNPLSRYELDVSVFRNLIEACRAHAHSGQSQDCAECAARLAQAVNLVRGPFLEGFSLPDCPAFDEWLSLERERLQQQITIAQKYTTSSRSSSSGFTGRSLRLKSGSFTGGAAIPTTRGRSWHRRTLTVSWWEARALMPGPSARS